MSAKGREENLFIRGGPRRGAENGNGNTFCPRRAAEGHGEHLNTILSAKGREGGRRTPFLSAKGRGGAGRTGQLHLSSDATIAREGRPQGVPLPIVFSRRYALGRVPTRGAPTDSGSLKWVCPNLMPLPWGGGSPAHGGIDLCGVPVACLNWGRAENRRKRRIRGFRSGLGLVA